MMKHTITPCNNPNQVVLHFGQAGMTLDDMSSSLFCNGGSGAGKTTSVLKLIIKSKLRLGLGMTFTTAKTDDCERIIQYVTEIGRLDDLIIVDPTGKYSMNLMEYRLNLTPEGASRAIAFTDLLSVVNETYTTVSQAGEELFWRNEQDRLSSNTLVLIEAAGEQVTAPLCIEVITSVAESVEQLRDNNFLDSSRCVHLLDAVLQSENKDPEVKMAIDYFMHEIPSMADRTWASIKSGVLGTLNRLVRGLFPRILGAKTTNVTPEMCYEQNKIIILNTPPAKYGDQGTVIQALFVYGFMQKMLQRDLKQNANYVALICDEFQTLLSNRFLSFVSMSRSNRIINLFATQSISACRVKIGGMHANDTLEAFLGNMRTKILMSHSEPNSNRYSSDLIGQHMAHRKGYHMGAGAGGISANASEFMKYLVEPHEFMVLKNGGVRNGYICEAYITMTGRQFDGLPYMKVAFSQKAS